MKVKLITEAIDKLIKEELADTGEQMFSEQAQDFAVAFPGRFQPFHSGHYKTYKWLCDKFGESKVFICTSDHTEGTESPLTFDEKRRVIASMYPDIPTDHVVEVYKPYAPYEVFDNYETEHGVGLVLAIGEKDQDRLKGHDYYVPYNPRNPMENFEQAGYKVIVPKLSNLTGTSVREFFSNPNYKDPKKKIIFQNIYGKFDEDIYDLFCTRFSKGAQNPMEMTENNLMIGYPTAEQQAQHNKKVKGIRSGLESNKEFQYDVIARESVLEVLESEQSKLKTEEISQTSLQNIFKRSDIESNGKILNLYVTKYLPTIFPESAIKDIVYHKTTSKEIHGGKFRLSRLGGVYFSFFDIPSGGLIKWLFQKIMSENTILAKVNVRNPFIINKNNAKEVIKKIGMTTQNVNQLRKHFDLSNNDAVLGFPNPNYDLGELDDFPNINFNKSGRKDIIELAVFDPDNIHILGSKQDLAMFRQFLSENNIDLQGNSVQTESINEAKTDWYNKTITNPSTGRNVKIKSALTYAPDNPLRIKAEKILNQYDQKTGRAPMGDAEEDMEDFDPNAEMSDTGGGGDFGGGGGMDFGSDSMPGDEMGDEGQANVTKLSGDDFKLPIEIVKGLSIRRSNKFDEYEPEGEFSDGEEAFSDSAGGDMDFGDADAESEDSAEGDQAGEDEQEDVGEDLPPKKESVMRESTELLTEGGSYGHMQHVHDNYNMTIRDLKHIIVRALTGRLDMLTEKTDGINLSFTVKDGQIMYARNKGHLKTGAVGALNKYQIIQKFEGKPKVIRAISDAVRSIEQNRDLFLQNSKIFENGKTFLNMEVIHPVTRNVIDYSTKIIVFHALIRHDAHGNKIDEDQFAANDLYKSISKSLNRDYYDYSGPTFLKLEINPNAKELILKYIGQIDDWVREYKLHDDNKLKALYQAFWVRFLVEKADKFGYKIPTDVFMGLVDRWMFHNKSYQISAETIDNSQFLDWAEHFDKFDYKVMAYKETAKLKNMMYEIGSEVINQLNTKIGRSKNAKDTLRVSLKEKFDEIKQSQDPDVIGYFKGMLEQLNKMGGFSNLPSIEGITFHFKGNIYKMTGMYSIINNLLNLKMNE